MLDWVPLLGLFARPLFATKVSSDMLMAFVRLQSARWAIGHATGIAGVILRDTLVLLAIRAILLGFYFGRDLSAPLVRPHQAVIEMRLLNLIDAR